MSDLAEQFYSAWTVAFYNTKPPQKLLCSWHVDRAWREHLKKLTDTPLRVTVYHNLRVLLEETDECMFEVLLEKTVQNLKDSDATCEFAECFEKYYVKRKEEWAVCYRKESLINTNMYVEAFHRVLKYIYT